MEAPLAEFKAGKLTRSGATLAPDPRKGLVRLCQASVQGENGRAQGVPEEAKGAARPKGPSSIP